MIPDVKGLIHFHNPVWIVIILVDSFLYLINWRTWKWGETQIVQSSAYLKAYD